MKSMSNILKGNNTPNPGELSKEELLSLYRLCEQSVDLLWSKHTTGERIYNQEVLRTKEMEIFAIMFKLKCLM